MFGGIYDINVSDEQAALVGKVAIEWAIVETSLQRILATLIGKDVALGLAATSNMGNKSMLDCLRALAGSAVSSSPTFWPDFVPLLDEYDRLLGLRNRIVHAAWEPRVHKEVWPVLVLRLKGKAKNYIEEWRKDDITQILAECGELTAALYELAVKHKILEEIDAYAARQASTGKQVERLSPVIQPRSPKSEAVLRQLLASRA